MLRKAIYWRYDLQLWGWSPLRYSHFAVSEWLFLVDHFTLNSTLEPSKEIAQGFLGAPATCPKAEGYESTKQNDPEQDQGPVLSLSCC